MIGSAFNLFPDGEDDMLHISGGAGDHTWVLPDSYADVLANGDQNYGNEFYGGEGNDYMLGTHLVTYGDMWGNDGDDKIYGGSLATGAQYLYGDTSVNYGT